MTNLSDECKKCRDNTGSIMMCMEICSVPMDILKEHERNRMKEEKGKT